MKHASSLTASLKRRLVTGAVAVAFAVIAVVSLTATAAEANSYSVSGTVNTVCCWKTITSPYFGAGNYNNPWFDPSTLPLMNDCTHYLKMRAKDVATGAIYSGSAEWLDSYINKQFATGVAGHYFYLYVCCGGDTQTRSFSGTINNVDSKV